MALTREHSNDIADSTQRNTSRSGVRLADTEHIQLMKIVHIWLSINQSMQLHNASSFVMDLQTDYILPLSRLGMLPCPTCWITRLEYTFCISPTRVMCLPFYWSVPPPPCPPTSSPVLCYSCHPPPSWLSLPGLQVEYHCSRSSSQQHWCKAFSYQQVLNLGEGGGIPDSME